MQVAVSNRQYLIHYSRVVCTGAEESLLNCSFDNALSLCFHQCDAAIYCMQEEFARFVVRYSAIVLSTVNAAVCLVGDTI